jgi:UDP-N-acetyl-D-galactosamine dehydrogenase
MNVDVHDAWANRAEAEREYVVALVDQPQPRRYQAMVPAVAHRQFRQLGANGIRALGRSHCVLYDVKQVFRQGTSTGACKVFEQPI